MTHRKHLARRLAVAGLAASLAFGAGAARAAERITMATTGKGATPQWGVFIAIANGYFKEAGIDFDFVAQQSTAAAMQQLAAGSAEMAAGGMTDPITAIDHGAKISLLCIETQVPPYTMFAKKSIASMKDLRGKIVIVGGAKDITMAYFERMAAANGLKAGDYDVVYAGTTPARYAALASGSVDAAILYPPAIFKAEQDGYSNLGDVRDYVHDLPFTGYAVLTSWAAQHKPLLVRFVKALHKGIDRFYDKSHREEAVDILTKESGAPRDDIEKTYDFYVRLHVFPDQGYISEDSIAGLVKALQQMGSLDGPADPKRFVDPEIAAIAPEALGHKP